MLDQDTLVVRDIIRVFMFEHWARFYYTVEKDGKPFLEMPADVLDDCRAKYPDLTPLLEEASGKELSIEACMQNVGAFVCRLLDGDKYPPGVVTKAMDSKPFRIELHLFGLWLQGHETYLDERQLSFDDWLEMFTNWKLMDKVQEFIAKLEQSPADNVSRAKTTH
ncbi:hypothetical protein [Fundidesulfovibrio terrae]|uniref:hypothetical protein n=1 Tax=Fundidesulfovibrio terrae TaxID=2922866 RepID=UPI001FAE9239|nr:hypothetical protein [Fundidesulfovibrio terrae]